MPTAKPTLVSANTQLLTWMNKFNDLLDYSSLWDGGQLAKLTEDTGFSFTLSSGGNLNNLKSTTKTYVPANAVNSPLAVVGVVNIDAVDANNATQLFTTLSTGVVRKFSRNLVAGTWTAWTEYASTSLASTTNPGLMSPTDKTNINNLLAGQMYKLTDNDGRSKAVAAETDMNTLVEAGSWMVSTQVNSPFPGTSYWYFVEVLKHNGSYVTQRATRFASGSDVRTYIRQLDAGVWLPWRRMVDSNLLGTVLMGNKLVDLISTNLANKVSGSTAANPHTVRQTAYTSPRDPSLAGSELPDTLLSRLYSLDGTVQTYSNSTTATMVTQTYSFNIVEHLQRIYGTVPGATLADKVAWVKANTTKLIFSWWGYGSTVGGNKAYVSAWSAPTSAWLTSGSGYNSHSNGTVTKITSTNTNTDVRIDANGFAHFVAYTDVSDGTTASSLNTDYVELQIEVTTDIKTNLPLATTASDGVMSKADKTALDNAQKWKLTNPDGRINEINGSQFDLNSYSDTGYYYAQSNVQNIPLTGYAGYLEVLKVASGYSTQRFTVSLTNALKVYERFLINSSWTSWILLSDNRSLASTLLGNKFVDQSTANFVGKVAGSTTANPHVYKYYNGGLTTLENPSSSSFVEDSTLIYQRISGLDSSYGTGLRNINGVSAQTLFSFNLIEHVQRTYGTIPGVTTSDKVAWLKANLLKLTFNWWGFGSSPVGNKANIEVWTGSGWTINWNTNTASSPSKLSNSVSGGAMQGSYIGSDGLIHFLAFAQASDGTIASVINTDYVELQVELSTDIKSSMPLATTTTSGDMSASDKLALDNAQKVKLTLDTGVPKIPPSDDANLIVEPGYYSSGASTKNVPVQYGTIFHIQRHTTNFIQMFQNNSEGLLWIRAYNGYWTNWIRSTDSKIFANTLMGNKFIEQTLMSFSNKIAGSTTENPHRTSAIYGATTTLAPGTAETVQAVYDALKVVDLSRVIVANSGAGQVSQQLFSFNVLEHVQRTYGNVPGTNTAEKVAWLKSNVSKLTFNWWGFGSSPTGNRATIKAWALSSLVWANFNSGVSTTTSASVSKLSGVLDSAVSNVIDSSGFAHFLAYADASDGTTSSTLSSDYVELSLEVSLDYGSAMKPQWVTATLQNSWVEFDATQTPKFNLGKDGFVDLVGAIKLGVLGQTAFTLPVGYRPTKMIVAMGIGAPGNHYRIIVATSGAVTIDQSVGTNGNAAVYLDNIRFPTT